MPTIEQIVSKIRKPPSLPNWVRLNRPNRDETTQSIKNFALGHPRHSLAQIYDIVAARVTLQVDDRTTWKSWEKLSNPTVKTMGKQILTALLPWLDKEGMKGIEAFHDMTAMYPIGRGILVPVKPTFVLLSEGVLEPVFVIGWRSISLDDFQMRLLATIIHEAILTQEGFEGSDARIILVPKNKWSRTERRVFSWKTSQQRRLTRDELEAQFDRFGKALDDAIPLILEALARRGEL